MKHFDVLKRRKKRKIPQENLAKNKNVFIIQIVKLWQHIYFITLFLITTSKYKKNIFFKCYYSMIIILFCILFEFVQRLMVVYNKEKAGEVIFSEINLNWPDLLSWSCYVWCSFNFFARQKDRWSVAGHQNHFIVVTLYQQQQQHQPF